jgi:hypothetical protein
MDDTCIWEHRESPSVGSYYATDCPDQSYFIAKDVWEVIKERFNNNCPFCGRKIKLTAREGTTKE